MTFGVENHVLFENYYTKWKLIVKLLLMTLF
jgi:hypothetical protein